MGMVWMAKDEVKRGRRDDLRLGYGEAIRIATVKSTGKKHMLARIVFNDNKAYLYGDVLGFKLTTYKGKEIYDVEYSEPLAVSLDTITWENSTMSDKILDELKGQA